MLGPRDPSPAPSSGSSTCKLPPCFGTRGLRPGQTAASADGAGRGKPPAPPNAATAPATEWASTFLRPMQFLILMAGKSCRRNLLARSARPDSCRKGRQGHPESLRQ